MLAAQHRMPAELWHPWKWFETSEEGFRLGSS